MNKVIACRDLVKNYRDGDLHVDVLKGIHFSVEQSEMVGVIGVSGAGKSTFLQLLGGLDKPTSGMIEIMGQSINAMSESVKGKLRNQHLGFVYQFHHLLPEFNALENVCMPLLIRNIKAKEATDRARDIIQKVGLKNRLQHRVSELSGGERQRIAIARALVTEPQCVLADEPTGNLDQHTANHVFELMMELKDHFKTSFVIVTHNETLAHRLDRVLQIKNGYLVEL